MSYQKYTDNVELWVNGINVSARRVTDIGGGENPIIGRVQSWNVQDYKILDFYTQPEIRLHPNWVEQDIEQSAVFPSNVDIIFCLEVLPYLDNLNQAIINMRNMLKTNGKFYISFMDIKGTTYIEGGETYQYRWVDNEPEVRSQSVLTTVLGSFRNLVFRENSADDFHGFIIEGIK